MPLYRQLNQIPTDRLEILRARINRDARYYQKLADRLHGVHMRDDETHQMLVMALRVVNYLQNLRSASYPSGNWKCYQVTDDPPIESGMI